MVYCPPNTYTALHCHLHHTDNDKDLLVIFAVATYFKIAGYGQIPGLVRF